MKNWIFFLFVVLFAVQPVFAQRNIWKEIFTPPAFHETQASVEEKLEKAFIRNLQKSDKKPQAKGQLRAYKFNSKAVLKIQFTAASYIPSNYNKETANSCRGLLIDQQGTVILNDVCRRALFFTKDKLTFIVDFNNVVPGYKIKISNFPKNQLIGKKNYLVAKLPMPQALRNKLPKITAPILVATSGRLLASGDPYLLSFQLNDLFTTKNQDSLIKMLPNEFYAKAEGFY